MKYGENLAARSVPQWAPYNIDYDTLKHMIKANTTRNAAQAVAIPGHLDDTLRRFESQFFDELCNQHERVDLFVRSKADEIHRRLGRDMDVLSLRSAYGVNRKIEFVEKATRRLLDRCANANGRFISQRKLEKFAKYENRTIRCGDDIRLLERFVNEQRVAFYKILKKYKKWTGSRSVGDRFNQEVLNNPKSFTKMDFSPLHSRYTEIVSFLRTSTPETSEPTTPMTASRQSSAGPAQRATPVLSYWNEYDDPSDGENEPYMISVRPEPETRFPGANALSYIISQARGPVEKIKGLLSPTQHHPSERQPLIQDRHYFPEQQSTLDTTDAEDDASSCDLPSSGYITHYATTIPSLSDQKNSRNRETLLFRSCIVCFTAAFMFLFVAGMLAATGRRRLRAEVDAGVITGVVASLFFGILAFACMLHRGDRLDWLHRSCVVVTFTTVCVLDGIMLVYITENMIP
ncbi:SPX-containing protein [Venustampulla echinocandica]|uniref:SPX-containing protein n=1 Tax=Venustampulla echinocandica TaxID=2656787 RepID=A0A370TQU8_9HELO|nr:SPX-containing protein [Venustampulla echinocandica]RDL37899.1 SPX-containing protein [Venustampulla echinocandica]